MTLLIPINPPLTFHTYIMKPFAITLLLTLFTLQLLAQPPESTTNKHNRLAHSQSPYLLQHANNPVNWYPWGDEAFEAARRENKPVLLSIGYSTCHWCHVMNRESFSDPITAKYLNENFICIKVDREERPDVDTVYMNFVQRLTGSGGWPLNVWLTPERKPIFGGTYFPPKDKATGGHLSFIEILSRIHHMWTEDNSKLLAQTEQIFQSLNTPNPTQQNNELTLDNSLRSKTINAFYSVYDEKNGGFGGDPKFPSPANLSFLLHAATDPNIPQDDREAALLMATTTLKKIAAGGIHDHIGGGFHRYTVDRQWKLPHFEKMLYDQALLANAYLDAWLITKNETFKDAATNTLNYLLRDMQAPQGGFYSAEDAESIDPLDPKSKREGAFYVWSWQELAPLLKDQALTDFARDYYCLQQEGNAPDGPYHTQDLQGFNTLRTEKNLQTLCTQHNISLEQGHTDISQINAILFKERQKRKRPHCDDKIITAWNGLVISALARAAQHLENERFANAAIQAALFIKEHLYSPQNNTLTRLYRNTPSTVKGFADDYAFLITGLIDLYETTANPEWLSWAKQLQDKQIQLFYDSNNTAFFTTQSSEEIIFNRTKDDYDGAIPATNSVSVLNLARLGQFFADADYKDKARQCISFFLPTIKQSPRQMPTLLEALPYITSSPTQIIIAGDTHSSKTQELLHTINNTYVPNRILIYAESGPSQTFLSKNIEILNSITPINGEPTVFLCQNYVCQAPTSQSSELKKQLDQITQNHTPNKN